MKIDYNNETLAIRGRIFTLGSLKEWFIKNYQPLLHKYHIKGNTFDWHAVISDIQQNGIIEIFESDKIKLGEYE